MTSVDHEETELARRVAAMAENSWHEYWTLADSNTRLSSDAAVLRARKLYDLHGEVQFDAPSAGWRDQQLPVAASMLTLFGDAYALLSVPWPQGLPSGALPAVEDAAGALRSSGLDRWFIAHGRELPAGPSDVRRVIRESSEQDMPLTRALYDARTFSLEDMRSHENPHWNQFQYANTYAATTLNMWAEEYRNLMLVATGGRDSLTPDGVALVIERLVQLRPEAVSLLLDIRRTFSSWQTMGAQAEAVVALGLTGALIRSMFLLGSATDTEDYASLHAMPVEDLDELEGQFMLLPWIESHARRS